MISPAGLDDGGEKSPRAVDRTANGLKAEGRELESEWRTGDAVRFADTDDAVGWEETTLLAT